MGSWSKDWTILRLRGSIIEWRDFNLNQVYAWKEFYNIIRQSHFPVFSLSTDGEVKTISMRISQDNQKSKERRNIVARTRLVQMIEEIKTGKVLILISSFYIMFTLPHTIDQFVYLLDFRKFCIITNEIVSLSTLLRWETQSWLFRDGFCSFDL